MAKVKTICICLPADLAEELRATAAKLGISVSALVKMRLYTAEKSQLNSVYGVEVARYGEDNG